MDRDVPVVPAVVDHVEKQGAKRRHPDPASNEEYVMALHVFVLEAVAKRSAQADLISGVQLVDALGDFADPHDTELQIILARGGRIDDEGGLAGAEYGKLADLAGTESELAHLFLIVQS